MRINNCKHEFPPASWDNWNDQEKCIRCGITIADAEKESERIQVDIDNAFKSLRAKRGDTND